MIKLSVLKIRGVKKKNRGWEPRKSDFGTIFAYCGTNRSVIDSNRLLSIVINNPYCFSSLLSFFSLLHDNSYFFNLNIDSEVDSSYFIHSITQETFETQDSSENHRMRG